METCCLEVGELVPVPENASHYQSIFNKPAILLLRSLELLSLLCTSSSK